MPRGLHVFEGDLAVQADEVAIIGNQVVRVDKPIAYLNIDDSLT